MKPQPKKRGPKPKPNARRNPITIRLDDAAWARVCRQAKAAGVTPREYAARVISEGVTHDAE